ncbi:hypothetical protein Q5752_004054 [Cryptotrichosporon argae]
MKRPAPSRFAPLLTIRRSRRWRTRIALALAFAIVYVVYTRDDWRPATIEWQSDYHFGSAHDAGRAIYDPESHDDWHPALEAAPRRENDWRSPRETQARRDDRPAPHDHAVQLLETQEPDEPETYPARVPITTSSSLILGEHGMAHGWQEGDTRHPVEQLVLNAKQKWGSLLARQSQTLGEAVTEYRRRYKRDPPRGFDRWWEFAVKHDVQIKDDYDQIFKDTKLFWALSPADFRERIENLKTTLTHSYEIHVDPSGQTTKGGQMDHSRADEMRLLLEGIAPYLPAQTDILVSLHDLGSTLTGHDQQLFLEDKIRKGEYATAEDLKLFQNGQRHADKGVKGIANACPPDSPAWVRDVDTAVKPWVRPIAVPADDQHPNFIYAHRDTFDFCYNTDLLTFHGEYSYDFPRASKLEAVFQQSKYAGNGNLILTPLDYYKNASHPESVSAYVPWEEKTVPKLFWRGSMTGDHYDHRKDSNWRNSHRIRLHTKTHETDGTSPILVQNTNDGTWYTQEWSNAVLNEAYMDVGLTGKAFQCNKEDGTCNELDEAIQFAGRVQPSEAAKYKLDGNGWSARFHRLLLSGAVVFKSTVNPEWYSDWLIPWYHYVPLQVTYAEMYTTLAYFIGPPGKPEQGHDDVAREIGENGRDFRLRYWRWEDMQSYMLRLLLEYVRLESDQRNDWNYRP